MMMPRKKRRMLIILLIIFVFLILIGILIALYLNTDIFKTNEFLFTKYVGQNIENLQGFSQEENSEYDELIKQNKCTSETEIKVNYTENIGTSSENTQNAINQLKIQSVGQTDISNNYQYQDIKLLKSQETVTEVEYLQKENFCGIRFSDLFKQFLLVEDESLNELFQQLGLTTETSINVPNIKQWQNMLKLSDEEKQNLRTKYFSILYNGVEQNNFSKSSNEIIAIDNKSFNTNAYSINLKKEQFNNIYIQILEAIKQDEIILGKIEDRQQTIEAIENEITLIRRNNIGQEEAAITVYESNGVTIKTVLQNPDYEIDLQVLQDASENYMQITYKNVFSEQESVITYKKSKDDLTIRFNNTENGEIKQYSFVKSESLNESTAAKDISFKYEDDSNRVEAKIKQNMTIVEELEKPITITQENSINLNELTTEQIDVVKNTVNPKIYEKLNQIETNVIAQNELNDVLETVGLMKKQQNIEQNGVSETEKNRFNSRFELLQGEKLNGEAMLRLVDAIKDNLTDIEVVSNTELELKIDQFNHNEEWTTKLTDYINKFKNTTYNVKVKYDETTGLVNAILLAIEEK